MSDITIRVESLSKVHRTGARQSGIFHEIEIRRNLPPSWTQAVERATEVMR